MEESVTAKLAVLGWQGEGQSVLDDLLLLMAEHKLPKLRHSPTNLEQAMSDTSLQVGVPAGVYID